MAIIDDEPLARLGIVARLALHQDVQVVAEYPDSASASTSWPCCPADLVFVDVEMPGISGLDWLASMPSSTRPLAIMVTAYDTHAVRAFELRALDYLLKPIDDARFDEAMDRARQAHHARTHHSDNLPAAVPRLTRLQATIGKRNVVIQVDDIAWIEADGDYVVVHVGSAVYLVRTPLYKLSQSLDGHAFARVHRSAVVNLARVSEWTRLPNRDLLLRLSDGTALRASRTYADDMLTSLMALAR